MSISKSNFSWVKRPGFDFDPTIYYNRKTGKLYRNCPDEIRDGQEEIFCLSSFNSAAPLKVYFDFTYRCNLECRHCITSSSPRVNTDHELSTHRLLELISELSSIGVLELATGGGEPFVRPDWAVIFQKITDSGINLIITTNGLLLSPSIIETLCHINPLEIRVSIDGGPSLHEHIRGRHTYAKTIANLGALVKNGLNGVARLTLCKDSGKELPVLLDDLAKIGILNIKVATVKENGRAATDQGKHLLYPANSHEAINGAIKLATDRGIQLHFSSDDFPYLGNHAHDPKIRDTARPNCGAGFETCYISPKGQIFGCVTISEMVFGDLQANSFLEVWQSEIAKKYRRRAILGGQRRFCDALCCRQNQPAPLA